MDTKSDAQVVETISHEAAQITDTSKRKLLALTVLLFIMFLSAFSWAAWVTYQNANDQAIRGTDLAQQVALACADPSTDTRTIEALCVQADKVIEEAPQGIAGERGDKGDTGDAGSPGPQGPAGPGPTYDQIYAAVVQALGTPVAQSRVRAAVDAYCSTRNQCRGLQGQNGTNGTNGTDGQAGQNGRDGKDGTNGKDGVPFTIVFTLEDTTVTCTVTGPEPVACTSSSPTPDPEPTEPPIIEVNP